MYVFIYIYVYIYIDMYMRAYYSYQWSDPKQPPCLADPSEGPPPAKPTWNRKITFWSSKVLGKSSTTLWKMVIK